MNIRRCASWIVHRTGIGDPSRYQNRSYGDRAVAYAASTELETLRVVHSLCSHVLFLTAKTLTSLSFARLVMPRRGRLAQARRGGSVNGAGVRA